MYRWEAWTRHVWLWSIPLAVCLVNLAGMLIYRTSFAGKVEVQQSSFASSTAQVARMREENRQSEEFLARAMARREQVRKLYEEDFASASERLTETHLAVKSLARKAGLNPTSFSYPKSSLGWGLDRLEIQFSVVATYEQLRVFVSLLEQSDLFLALERVELAEATGGAALAVSLSLWTVFVAEEEPGAGAARRAAEAGGDPS